MSFKFCIKLYFGLLLFQSCSSDPVIIQDTLFEEMPPHVTAIDFINKLDYTEEFNIYTFRNFYNGAGVGLGDFNNDDKIDIFFSGNQVDNRLYLNQGDFRFLDISVEARVTSQNVWSTGVSLADVNGDGWLDIYVCKSGDAVGLNRHNELFINQGVRRNEMGVDIISFKEESKKYGLDDLGLSTHAAFFDYDLDGDLDCYLLNNSFRSIGNYDLRPDQRNVRDTAGGNKLFRNNTIGKGVKGNEPIFEDVSETAGIYGSSIGFGLGVSIGDVNNDGWPDIYVSNDFFEKDYLYINQHDGSFKESSDENIDEMSMGSMGADMADINNDGLTDIFVTEMLPRNEIRSKTKAQFENWNKFQSNVSNGYHYQFARNVLQLNDRDGNFKEIGRLANVEATDWSWGALIFDMDNDGWKDIYVANGIFKDILDQDYINFYANPEEVRKILFDKDKGGLDKLVDLIPTEALANFAFKNNGNLVFENVSGKWGLAKPSFSNGSAYADLDNDGDLDIVVNNINMAPFVYRNRAKEGGGNQSLQIILSDTESLNRRAIGAKVYCYNKDTIQMIEVNPNRGFMSSVDTRVHFAVRNKVDSVMIVWPDLKVTVLKEPPLDQLIKIEKNNVSPVAKWAMANNKITLLTEVSNQIPFKHLENVYSDFDREPLLFQMHSNLGPAVAQGDLNNDGRSDLFIGGANGQSAQIYLQEADGTYTIRKYDVITNDSSYEDATAVIFDANGDEYMDLYIGSGSSEYGPNNANLMDRLYINESGRKLVRSNQILPTFNFENTSSVTPLDFDLDGDMDLLVTTFVKPFSYGIPSSAYLLENDGKANFTNVSDQRAPELKNLGLLTDAKVGDIDGDADQDIVIVGEWMSPQIFINENGSYKLLADEHLFSLTGLWNTIYLDDLDEDGDQDMVLGNHGLNSRLKASAEYPLHFYYNDFDGNGKAEQVFSYSTAEGEYPLAQRGDLLKQLPYLSRKYPDYKSYAGQRIQSIFTEEQLNTGFGYNIKELRTIVLWNKGELSFESDPLPVEAQLSPVYAICADDIDGDSIKDLLMGGNQFRMKPELGINAASEGLLLVGSKNHKFTSPIDRASGLSVKGEIRRIVELDNVSAKEYMFVRNNDGIVVYKIK